MSRSAFSAVSVLCLGVLLSTVAPAWAGEFRVLLKNPRHAVTAEYDGDHITFLLEALDDRSDNLDGNFPRIDFAGIAFDVDRNGRVDKGTDFKLGIVGGTRDRVCAQYYESESAYTGCGGARSRATLTVRFEATSLERQPHPVWSYRVPTQELARDGKVAHVAVQFHEARSGYASYPEGGRANVAFDRVLRVPLVPPSRVAEVARPMVEYKVLERGRQPVVELLRNDRHVISARRGRGSTTFILEAIGDTTDNLQGTYPNLDFASLRVDVDQNLAVSEKVDRSYGAVSGSSDQICSQFLLTASTSTGCGAAPSGAGLSTRFSGTPTSSTPHPSWSFTIPNGELSSGGVAHLVFRFHEAGVGYTVYPEPTDASQPFSQVAALNLKTLKGGVRPESSTSEPEPGEPEVVVNDTTPPLLTLTEPAPADARISLDAKTVRVAGQASDESGVYEILVDGQDASVSADGGFWADLPLQIGENQFRVRASDSHGNWNEVGVTVVRESAAPPPTVEGGDESRGLEPTVDATLEDLTDGTYHALLIAVQDYDDPELVDLDHPLADARRLKQVLVDEYLFDEANVTMVENPDEAGVFAAFREVASRAGADDSVLVFFAGHGTWNELTARGYWLPRDATSDSPASWIENSAIVGEILGLGAKHTLLVSDACFSGGIFKTRSAFMGADRAIQELHRLPSRKAMTSGTLTEVPDDSVFLDYLIDRLDNATAQWTTADALFADFRQAVINNSPTTPQYGVIFEAGDEGGEFVFIRR